MSLGCSIREATLKAKSIHVFYSVVHTYQRMCMGTTFKIFLLVYHSTAVSDYSNRFCAFVERTLKHDQICLYQCSPYSSERPSTCKEKRYRALFFFVLVAYLKILCAQLLTQLHDPSYIVKPCQCDIPIINLGL
ncbi:hypothetical protein BCR41DRAFT_373555 [Lobosporangium transversale]|uniref:Uncharacterized protein n=1 Tax=Lobosporangium transversale TaxID=64571 RepID=A0A1Y2GDJ7_9FUNG|nr:hypothetical protein BCR41DRAFT_373555 [Lobosporangium transversale]ORZ07799.1 hypothetical protein BCR41DRAFT_373555 [Lobosporangium transversale]|eukprot:XP_021878165.1 hypothetical protein BCR41DRAFT_373555 [Lobosporangium transversale]